MHVLPRTEKELLLLWGLATSSAKVSKVEFWSECTSRIDRYFRLYFQELVSCCGAVSSLVAAGRQEDSTRFLRCV